MKKIFAVLAIAGFLTACNNSSDSSTSSDTTITTDTTTTMSLDTSNMAPMDTMSAAADSAANKMSATDSAAK